MLSDIHEICTLPTSNFCKAGGMPNTFPAWSFVAIYFSHFLLAVNAAFNMGIYCLMSPKFRGELKATFNTDKCRLLKFV